MARASNVHIYIVMFFTQRVGHIWLAVGKDSLLTVVLCLPGHHLTEGRQWSYSRVSVPWLPKWSIRRQSCWHNHHNTLSNRYGRCREYCGTIFFLLRFLWVRPLVPVFWNKCIRFVQISVDWEIVGISLIFATFFLSVDLCSWNTERFGKCKFSRLKTSRAFQLFADRYIIEFPNQMYVFTSDTCGEQGCRSGDFAPLPPTWPKFDLGLVAMSGLSWFFTLLREVFLRFSRLLKNFEIPIRSDAGPPWQPLSGEWSLLGKYH